MYVVNGCCMCCCRWFGWWFFFFFKQKTAYEMRISDWSSDVCSSDLEAAILAVMEGDIIRVTNPPVWLPGGPYELLVEARSEERRVGKECVSTCRSRWSPYH